MNGGHDSGGAPLRITLIAAVAKNGVIGANGQLPFRQRSDLQFFKSETMGKCVLMGRTTYASLGGRRLLGRTLIVLSRAGFADDGSVPDAPVYGAHSLDAAFSLAARLKPEGEIMVAGGAQLYGDALPLARRLLLTRILANPSGDVFFPPVDYALWQLVSRHMGVQGEGDDHPFGFEDWRRLT